ncbi:hypothetical protein RB195_008799 [Necator americanus]|uniref:Integrin alpha-2 domain-containing protein n=1 Tax=Necator americanus TaxID=51031 RepID=A0ABR1CQF4_NECAM
MCPMITEPGEEEKNGRIFPAISYRSVSPRVNTDGNCVRKTRLLVTVVNGKTSLIDSQVNLLVNIETTRGVDADNNKQTQT